MSHGQLDIYKASAGSGKTHTLTHKYISFLLADGAEKDAYKHILAVTFTNKATEEMKSRIMKTLYELSQGKGEELEGLDPGEKAGVMARAKAALTAILHDYSNFQVCTIDRFFQQIFRSFARELGSFSNYRVELRDDDVLTHVVDDMLSGLDDDAAPEKSFDIINKFALDQLRYKSNNGYEKQLLEFAQLFVKEDFKVKSASYRADLKQIEAIECEAEKTVAGFETSLRSMSAEAMATIAKQGLTVEDFPYKKSGGMGQVQKYAKGEIKEPGERLLKLAAEGCNNNPELGALLTSIVELFGGYEQYRTAQIVRSNVGVMKIFRSIYDTLSAYLKENNIMLLGETTQALNKMIDGSETPFIYERVGSWIDHFLLDEFQDFSLMQWANFRPLLEQSLDSGNDNLIVGDVKQSIYRWRGSDWNTLDCGIQQEFAGRKVNPQTLSTNFRSDKAIVEFNNYIFKRITDKDSGSFEGDETIARAYEDCRQSVNSGKEGHVKITYLDNESSEVKHPALGALKGEIEALDGLGYPRSAVYVLVRTNAQASLVAEQLISDGIDVITDESLLVGVSSYVQRIVAVLKYIVNPDDATNLQVIKEIGVDVGKLALSGNSIYDICESIVRSLDRDLAEGQMPYLMTFMDLVLEYMRDHGSDMAGFLKWWEEIGCQQAVSAPRGANAVRIMTIHKAKGLGCPVVIMPFFHEPLTPRSDLPNYMWCDDSSPLMAGLLPVEFRKNAADTAFKGDYEAMGLLYKMDALNAAYVAFTRAKHELIVFAEKKTHKKGISDLLYTLLSSDDKFVNDVYEVGDRQPYDSSQEDGYDAEAFKMDSYNSIPMEGTDSRKRLALVYRGSDFFDPNGRDAARARGIVMHDILSRINTADDVAASVDTAVAGGELAAAERNDTVARVNEMLDSVKSYGWFSGEGEALNELSIIDTDGQVYRPDRVIIRAGAATVLDYKFGERHGGYRKQVARYMEMLRQMGYENVDGYLWYAAENNIEKVA